MLTDIDSQGYKQNTRLGFDVGGDRGRSEEEFELNKATTDTLQDSRSAKQERKLRY